MSKKQRYQVWQCKIVVNGDAVLPNAFDGPPRMAAIGAVEAAGLEVIGCFSGWAAKLTNGELAVVDRLEPPPAA